MINEDVLLICHECIDEPFLKEQSFPRRNSNNMFIL